MLKAILISLTFIKACHTANILLLYALYGKSHLLSYVPFLQELASDGHNITIFYADANKAPNFGPGISTIQTDMIPNQERAELLASMTWNNVAHGYLFPLLFISAVQDYHQLVDNQSDKLTQVLNNHWDLVMVDPVITIHGVALVEKLKRERNIPYIIFSSSQFLSFYQSNIALGWNYASSLSLMTPLPTDNDNAFKPMEFSNRLISFVESHLEIFLINHLVIPFFEHRLRDLQISNFFQQPLMSLSDNFDRLGDPLPIASDVHYIGSNCLSASKALNSQLPPDIEAFINDPASNGTIYVAFGTFAKWDHAPERIIHSFMDAFDALTEYRIIFVYNGKAPLKLGNHVRVVSWAPQAAILGHEKTKAFVTHGGLKSLKEAFCSEVPIILMPLLAEQAHNAKLALKLRIGTVINKFSLSSEVIASNIREVAYNPIFVQRISALKAMILHRPLESLKVGKHHIEKLIRIRRKFGGNLYDQAHERLTRRKGISLGANIYYSLDFVAYLGVIVFILSQ